MHFHGIEQKGTPWSDGVSISSLLRTLLNDIILGLLGTRSYAAYHSTGWQLHAPLERDATRFLLYSFAF